MPCSVLALTVVPRLCLRACDILLPLYWLVPVLKTSLLTYSSHTIQFTHLKEYTHQSFLVYSQMYTAITTVDFSTSSPLYKETADNHTLTSRP